MSFRSYLFSLNFCRYLNLQTATQPTDISRDITPLCTYTHIFGHLCYYINYLDFDLTCKSHSAHLLVFLTRAVKAQKESSKHRRTEQKFTPIAQFFCYLSIINFLIYCGEVMDGHAGFGLTRHLQWPVKQREWVIEIF